MPFGKGTLADALMAPTTIYVKPVLKLLDAGIKVRGMSHITAGGINGKLPRAFAKGIAAVVDTQRWKRPAIFDWLQEKGGAERGEKVCGYAGVCGFVGYVPSPESERGGGEPIMARRK